MYLSFWSQLGLLGQGHDLPTLRKGAPLHFNSLICLHTIAVHLLPPILFQHLLPPTFMHCLRSAPFVKPECWDGIAFCSTVSESFMLSFPHVYKLTPFVLVHSQS